ncbi:MAG: hypothetical protein J6J41_03940 [Clostridia bacterium]|nr:hypothetical protein [Clostridia bacterium]
MNSGAKCWACTFYDREREICTRDGSGYSGKHREKLDPACKGFRSSMLARRDHPKPGQMAAADPQIAGALAENVQRMGQYIGQLGQMMAVMQRRMDEMEKQQAAVTIRHEDVKRLQAMIRMRADQICGKYELTDKDSPRIFRAAIKKDLLRRYGVKDLHDVPAAMLGGAENMISGWTNIRLAMERRAKG